MAEIQEIHVHHYIHFDSDVPVEDNTLNVAEQRAEAVLERHRRSDANTASRLVHDALQQRGWEVLKSAESVSYIRYGYGPFVLYLNSVALVSVSGEQWDLARKIKGASFSGEPHAVRWYHTDRPEGPGSLYDAVGAVDIFTKSVGEVAASN